MPAPKSKYELIIADKEFEIDWPTYTFRDADPGFNAHLLTCTSHSKGRCGPGGGPYQPAKGLSGKINRFRKRHIGERSVAAAQAMIKQFVIHLDGCLDAEMCFNVLHNERGLSCHFVLDNDGTLYQTLDLVDCAYHAAGLNENSIGIEICNRGDAKKDPNFYDRPGMIKRDIVSLTINDSKYVAFEFTKPQYLAMEHLGRALAKYLPGIKLDYPQKSPGVQSWETLEPWDKESIHLRQSYVGYIGHYHITTQKWDPGPFDFKQYLSKLSGKRSFPLVLRGTAPKVEVPESPPVTDRDARVDYERTFQEYYENNELQGKGGYFPVGPLDHAQLYHGGIHLHAPKGSNVIAPFAGKIICARNGDSWIGIGSTNFVLMSHTISAGSVPINFYTLFFHLAKEEAAGGKKGERLKWMAGDAWQDAEAGKVVVMNPPEPVQAGDVIGHVGIAGPDNEPQVHWEIFTLDHAPVEKADRLAFWKVYSGAGDQRYCSNKEILAKVEKKKDGVLTEEEVEDVFRGDPADKEWTRHAVTYHYSEWSVRPDWKQALTDAPEYKKKPLRKREIDDMYDDQILPMLWWTDDVAKLLGLPGEAWVYTYHPVSFLMWLNDLVGVKGAEVSRKATAKDFAEATSKAKLDIDDTEGTSFVTEAELAELPPSKQLSLPDMVDGYGD